MSAGCFIGEEALVRLSAKGNGKKKGQAADGEEAEKLYLYVDRAKKAVIGARIVDFADNETLIRFTNLDLSPSLSKEKFKFKLPSGVYVDDQRSP